MTLFALAWNGLWLKGGFNDNSWCGDAVFGVRSFKKGSRAAVL